MAGACCVKQARSLDPRQDGEAGFNSNPARVMKYGLKTYRAPLLTKIVGQQDAIVGVPSRSVWGSAFGAKGGPWRGSKCGTGELQV